MKNQVVGKTIHFIGIGGISMSALAKLLYLQGYEVTGSDMRYGDAIDDLIAIGIQVIIGSDINMVEQASMVVYNRAITDTDIELAHAKKLGKPLLLRDELLGIIASQYRKVVAIAGTHGKTSTTAMASYVLSQTKTDITCHIGGMTNQLGGNLFFSGKDIFITEACEYKGSFHSLYPDIAVILNIELDHPDSYANEGEIIASFEEFCDNIKQGGTLITTPSVLKKIKVRKDVHIFTFGYESTCDMYPADMSNNNGCSTMEVMLNHNYMGTCRLKVLGEHNILNGLAALSIANALDVEMSDSIKYLKNFTGVHRRFEYKGIINGAGVYLDYAHHPSEILSTIKTAKSMTRGRVWVCFQPHTMQRTEKFFEQFVEALNSADEVVLLKTYIARYEVGGASSWQLFLALPNETHKYYYDDFVSAVALLYDKVKPIDTVLIMGAGDIECMIKIIK